MKALLLIALSGLLSWGTVVAAPETDLSLSSNDLTAGGPMPARFTCDGDNRSPSLRFSGLPEGTKSLALLLDDEDAPGGHFTHWICWNIRPETTEFVLGSVPSGVIEGINDFGKPGYGGPCPPSGEHRYTFHLFALNDAPQLRANARRAEFDAALKGHVLAKAAFTVRYSHQPLGK